MHNNFTRGIDEPIKTIVSNRKTASFNDAVKDAVSLELELEEERNLERERRHQYITKVGVVIITLLIIPRHVLNVTSQDTRQ